MRSHVLPRCTAIAIAASVAIGWPPQPHAATRPSAPAQSRVAETSTATTAASAQQGYVLPESQTWELTSKEGETYEIFVSRPAGTPPPKEGYPVLYVLDGNTIFASFAEARRIQEGSNSNIANTLIVAVGYPTGKPYDYERRMNDFTPPFPTQVPAAEKPFTHWKVGGQDRLFSFLLERLRPAVADRYPIDEHRQALFGHSLGGLFALHVLYRHPEAFNAIIAASPSIWWNDQAILSEEREFAARLSSSGTATGIPKLLLLVGAREETAVDVWDTQSLAKRLEPLSVFGLRTRLEVFQDETHITVPSRAVTTALRFAFSWP
jgi:predicted alpha/beta superfamily hydrolase